MGQFEEGDDGHDNGGWKELVALIAGSAIRDQVSKHKADEFYKDRKAVIFFLITRKVVWK